MKLKGKLLLVYTAGIFDGEGCTGIYKQKNRSKRGFSYTLIISIWSTNLWLIQWLKMQYGGSVMPRNIAGEERNPIWKWQLTSKKAREFLELILPYVYLKRPQVELAIKFQTMNTKWRRKDESQLAILEAQRILMAKMKRPEQ